MGAHLTPASSRRPRRFLRLLALAGRIAGVLVLFLLVAGAIYQWTATAREARLYPPPGRLVDVGGHRLHIDCIGQGSPTVIFDAGLGDSSVTWDLVQPDVAKFTRACTYDRAGLGWSELADGPRTSEKIVAELEVLLSRSDVAPPYVLVGHSFGGMNQRLYAFRHLDQVTGIVFVDSSHPDQVNRFPRSISPESIMGHMDVGVWTTPFGGPRLLHWCRNDYTFPNAPSAWDQFAPAAIALDCKETTWRAARAEEASFRESGREVAKATSLGNLPLIVLSHDPDLGAGFPPAIASQAEAAWSEMQEELRTLSSNGKRIIAKRSSHYVEVYRPELVIGAIREIVKSSPSSPSL